MKIYKINEPGSFPALMKLETEEGKPVGNITIGESGRGRSERIIPIVGEGPEIRVKKTDEDVVLVRGNWDDEGGRCLAVINTCGAYSQYRRYSIYDAKGVQRIETGYFAFGIAGRAGGGEEILAIVSPGAEGAEFRLDSKYASHWYRWDGEKWIMESPAEREARLALEEIKRGGGEWL